jgi:hypothetical protein
VTNTQINDCHNGITNTDFSSLYFSHDQIQCVQQIINSNLCSMTMILIYNVQSPCSTWVRSERKYKQIEK